MCTQLLLVSVLLSAFNFVFPFSLPREFSGFTPHQRHTALNRAMTKDTKHWSKSP